MSVLVLTNTVGAMASECDISDAPLKADYSAYDAISGPRNRTLRAEASGTRHVLTYTGPSTTVTHCVISNLNLFKGTTGATNVRLLYNGTEDSTTAVADLDLVGITGQDWVISIERTALEFAVRFLNGVADTYETEYGKVYFSTAFDFGTEPQKQVGMQGQRAQKDAMVQPMMGWEPYAVTNSFSLTFRNVSPAKMLEFEALPINFPLFLWDEDGDVFPHFLEHVIVTEWKSLRRTADIFDVSVSFARLKHYE